MKLLIPFDTIEYVINLNIYNKINVKTYSILYFFKKYAGFCVSVQNTNKIAKAESNVNVLGTGDYFGVNHVAFHV